MSRWFALAILVIAFSFTTGCQRSATGGGNQPASRDTRNKRVSETAPTMRDMDLARDKAASADRGFVDGQFTIGSGMVGTDRALTGKALGPFALGMTVTDVRAAARRNSMTVTVSLASPDRARDGWCAKGGSPDKPSSVLAPIGLIANLNGPQNRFTSYSIIFAPKRGVLTAVSVQQTNPRTKQVGPNLDRDWGPLHDLGGYGPCMLLAKEARMLAGWDHMENLALRDSLGPPKLDGKLLPQAVRTALDQWERETTVPCDQTISDCPSVDPSFDGWWEKDGRLVVSYSIYLGGESASVADYIVVANPDGSLAWTGSPREFAARGRDGKRSAVGDLRD